MIREFEENNSGVGLFHFDSDEDVFCVYSQYIDDLMMLAKMIRAACADEKNDADLSWQNRVHQALLGGRTGGRTTGHPL